MITRARGSNADEWLVRIGAAEWLTSLVLVDEDERWGPDILPVTALRSSSGYSLNGTLGYIESADKSDRWLVAAQMEGRPAKASLFLVDPAAQGVTVSRQSGLGVLRPFVVRLSEVLLAQSDVLGELGAAWPLVEEGVAVCALARSAVGLGAAQRTMEIAVDYARNRQQFGRPIGDYQSMQYQCTAMLSDVQALRSITFRAAEAFDNNDPNRSQLASVAKAWSNDACLRVARRAHRVMGAVGFAAEHELHHFTEMAEAGRANWGTSRFHRNRLSDAIDPIQPALRAERVLDQTDDVMSSGSR